MYVLYTSNFNIRIITTYTTSTNYTMFEFKLKIRKGTNHNKSCILVYNIIGI